MALPSSKKGTFPCILCGEPVFKPGTSDIWDILQASICGTCTKAVQEAVLTSKPIYVEENRPDFRIGNVVWDRWQCVPAPLILTPFEFGVRIRRCSGRDLSPIPLTSDELKRFKLEVGDYVTKHIMFDQCCDGFRFIVQMDDDTAEIGPIMESVHQLQNFYADLLSMELPLIPTE